MNSLLGIHSYNYQSLLGVYPQLQNNNIILPTGSTGTILAGPTGPTGTFNTNINSIKLNNNTIVGNSTVSTLNLPATTGSNDEILTRHGYANVFNKIIAGNGNVVSATLLKNGSSYAAINDNIAEIGQVLTYTSDDRFTWAYPAGSTGSNLSGYTGHTGATGPAGIQGLQGPAGIQGLQGPAGIQGLQGIQGPAGIQGLQGIQGPAGNDGLSIVGPTGPQGIQGPPGNASSINNLFGEVSGPVDNTVVNSVGGKNAAQISASVDDTTNATSSSVNNTLVKRNNFGNVTLNALTLSSGGNQLTLGNVTVAASGSARTMIMPVTSTSDALVSRTSTDTLTNKTLNSTTNNITANALRNSANIYSLSSTPPSNGQVLSYDSGSNLLTWNTVNSSGGAAGPAGADGATGPTGAVGPAGLNGADGAIGPAGNDGAIGPTGAAGPAGTNGLNGNDGAIGPTGPAGEGANLSGVVLNNGNSFGSDLVISSLDNYNVNIKPNSWGGLKLNNNGKAILHSNNFDIGHTDTNTSKMSVHNYTFAIPQSPTVNNTRDLFIMTLGTDGAASFTLHVNVNGTGVSISKTYHVNAYFDITGSSQVVLAPTFTANINEGNDFNITMVTNTSAFALFQFQRKTGFSGAFAHITIVANGNHTIDTSVHTAANAISNTNNSNRTYNMDFEVPNYAYSRYASIGFNNKDSARTNYALTVSEDSRNAMLAKNDATIASFKTNTYTTSSSTDVMNIWSPSGSGSTRVTTYVPVFINTNNNSPLCVNGQYLNQIMQFPFQTFSNLPLTQNTLTLNSPTYNTLTNITRNGNRFENSGGVDVIVSITGYISAANGVVSIRHWGSGNVFIATVASAYSYGTTVYASLTATFRMAPFDYFTIFTEASSAPYEARVGFLSIKT